jgi:hypothetical protein
MAISFLLSGPAKNDRMIMETGQATADRRAIFQLDWPDVFGEGKDHEQSPCPLNRPGF